MSICARQCAGCYRGYNYGLYPSGTYAFYRDLERLRELTSLAPVHTVSLLRLEHRVKTQIWLIPEFEYNHWTPLSPGGMLRHQEWIFGTFYLVASRSPWENVESQLRGQKHVVKSKTKKKTLYFKTVGSMRRERMLLALETSRSLRARGTFVGP